MFTETKGSRKAIGDVDVCTTTDFIICSIWCCRTTTLLRTQSAPMALTGVVSRMRFLSADPGSWDDLMLWTMHVSPDPHHVGRWRMFYTGLSRREQGRLQRIGLATSEDLFHWRKAPVDWRDTRGPHDPEAVKRARQLSRRQTPDEHYAVFDESSCFPLEADTRYYEASVDEGRQWISFRDPFYFREGDQGWLLSSGRIKEGPIIRRGCVSVLRETAANCFTAMPPLHTPQLYDDIEVPNLINLEGEYYLIGSIREDAKIRYWHTDRIGSPWRSYHDNVLMAKGNYAGRVSQDAKGWLLWNFFVMDVPTEPRATLCHPRNGSCEPTTDYCE